MPYDDRRLEQYGPRIKGIRIIGHERDFGAVQGASTRARATISSRHREAAFQMSSVPFQGPEVLESTTPCIAVGVARAERIER
jgi:hypothetical protein